MTLHELIATPKVDGEKIISLLQLSSVIMVHCSCF